MKTRTLLLAGAALLALAGTAQAQAQTPAPNGADPTETQTGTLVFEPAFFAQARPNTALEMVQRVPGFGIVDGDGSRGFEGAVGNVLINGARPASKTDTGSSVLSRTPASQVERIELIRGGAPGVDMQGFPLVVNVITKRQASMQHVLNANAFIFDGARDLYGGSYQVTARDGDVNWSVTLSDGVSMSDSNGPGTVVRTNAAGVVTRDEAVDGFAGGGGQSARATWAGPFAGGRIDLTGRYGVNDWEQESIQTSATVRRENLNANEGSGGELGVVYERPLTEKLKFEGRVIHQFSETEGAATNRTRLSGVDQPEQVFSFDAKSSESIVRGLVRHENGGGVTTELGAELAYNVLDTSQAFTVGGAPVPLPSDEVKVEEVRAEAFARSTWRISDKLTLETGLRLESSTISQSGDLDTEKDLFFAKPRAQLTWTPSQGNQFRFRVERDVGQLDFDDFAASANLQNDQVFGGNADLEPDQRWIFEGTYERRFWGDGVFSLTLRHDEISDVIDRIPLVGGFSAVGNIGDGTYDSARLSLTLPTDRLGISGGRLRTSATWQESSVTDPTTGDEREISGIRPFDANVAFTQDIQSLKTQWGFEWLRGFDEALFDPDQRTDVRLRNYRVLFVEWKPMDDLSLRAQVNIWDDFTVTRTTYSDRLTQAVNYVEVRDVDPRTFFQFRVRKSF